MTPRSVHKALLADPGFLQSLRRLAPDDRTFREARGYLREIAAAPSRLMVGLLALTGLLLYRRNYSTIRYDRRELQGLSRLATEHPIVFLPSHRSNLDRPVLHYLLWKNGRPPNYTAGGINMNFFPVGPMVRRAGVFFIRRTFGDNPVYKLVLRTYMAHLLEQRHCLEWYIEGTRSRTGKLLSPRYGLLGYAADALGAGKCQDIYLVPTSISYDHVEEIDGFADEQRGASKESESFKWLARSIRAMGKRYGDIHVRFGEPLSMLSTLGPGFPTAERRHRLSEMAAEVCKRINRVAPITPPSLVVVALLARRRGATTRSELRIALDELLEHVDSRRLPTTSRLPTLRNDDGIDQVIRTLSDRGIAVVESGETGTGGSPVCYRIDPDRRLAAAHYRNTIVHFFLPAAFAELALAASARDTHRATPERLREQVGKLGDLLEFEFFLGDSQALYLEVCAELTGREPQWEDRLAAGEAAAVLDRLRPHRAPWVLRPFIDAYSVVADQLVDRPIDESWDEPTFGQAALERGASYVAHGRVDPEAVSTSLFANALRAASRLDLIEPGTPDLLERREEFASRLARLRMVIETLDARPVVGVEVPADGT